MFSEEELKEFKKLQPIIDDDDIDLSFDEKPIKDSNITNKLQ